MGNNSISSIYDATLVLQRYAQPWEALKGNYTLDRMTSFLADIGNPQDKTRIIHVAGTSGKTSTAYFIDALLRSTGMKIGLTISPHLESLTERIQVDGNPVSDQEFLCHLESFLDRVEAVTVKLSYFELLTAFAFWALAERGVDYAVVECGIGGLRDATNTVSRADKICVIADIGIDHTDLLGNTIEQIAAHKAGIIQCGNRAFVLEQDAVALNVIKARARVANSDLDVISTSGAESLADSLPPFQRRNWLLARAVDRYVRSNRGIESAASDVLRQCAAVRAPGRFERLEVHGKQLILDGAHNPQKLAALRNALADSGVSRAAVLANFLSSPHRNLMDAHVTDMLAELRPVASHLIVPSFTAMQDVPRNSTPVREIAVQAAAMGFPSVAVMDDPDAAFLKLLERPEAVLIVTGSLYLVGRLRRQAIAMARC